MKNVTLSLILILCFCANNTFAQITAQGFNYQCIVRDASGAVMDNEAVSLVFSIKENSIDGEVIYSEIRETSTNEFGLINLIVGENSSDFGNIAWGSGSKYLTVFLETAPDVFEAIGSSQLVSVPYALYALEAQNSTVWLSGQTAPDDSNGQNNDFYINATNGNFYKKSAGAWLLQGTLGSTGGGSGFTIVGSVNDASELDPNYMGDNGDMFIAQDNGHGYTWDGTDWVDVGQIQGPQGAQGEPGPQGEQGPQGETGPQGEMGPQGPAGQDGAGVTIVGAVDDENGLDENYSGNTGDMFIAQDNGHGYVWSGTDWVDVGQIQGPQGAQGEPGPQGEQGSQGEAGQDGAVGPQGPPGQDGQDGEDGQNGTGVAIVGSVNDANGLDPNYNGNAGDMFIAQDNGHGHVWSGTDWVDVGQIRGPQGSQGEQGEAGPQGLMGETGPQGEQGPQGEPGPQGEQGIAGQMGPQGPAGEDGQDGQDGTGVSIVGSVDNANELDPNYNGNTGDMFIAQDDGHGHVWSGTDWVDVGQIRGPKGEQGEAGEAGSQGPQGEPGPQGEQGIPGQMGPQGPAGEDGQDGQDGTGVSIVGSVDNANGLDPNYNGNTGDMFIAQDDGHGHVWSGSDWVDVGQIRGPQGEPGSQGEQGLPGEQGPMGLKGETGPQGESGPQGEQGLPGEQGLIGLQGETGPQGEIGPEGPQGSSGTSILNGDVIGEADNSTVVSLQGFAIDSNTPQTGQVLQFQNGEWSPMHPSDAILNGDVVGEADNSTVIGLQGFSIDSSTPQSGQVLQFQNGEWSPMHPSDAILNGDVVGEADNSTVIGLQGFSIDSSTPQTGQVLQFQNGEWSPMSLSSSSTLNGDVTGDAENNTVMALRGIPLGQSTPQTGQVLKFQNGQWTAADDATGGGGGGSLWNDCNNEKITFSGAVGMGSCPGSSEQVRVVASDSKDTGVQVEVDQNGGTDIIGIEIDTDNQDNGNQEFNEGVDIDANGGRFVMGGFVQARNASQGNDGIILLARNENNGAFANGVRTAAASPTSSATGMRILATDNPDEADDFVETTNSTANNFSTQQNVGINIEVTDRSSNNSSSTHANRDIGLYINMENKVSDYAAYFDGDVGIPHEIEFLDPNNGNQWAMFIEKGNVANCDFSSSDDLILQYEGDFKGLFRQSDGNYCPASDRRLKENITNLSNILDKLLQLKPVFYNFKSDIYKSKTMGFIAQEIEPLFPELVNHLENDEYGDLLSLNYNGFGIIAVKAIQEQQEIIEEQQEVISNQQKRLEAVEYEIAEMKKMMELIQTKLEHTDK